jgi:hypothetical protein
LEANYELNWLIEGGETHLDTACGRSRALLNAIQANPRPLSAYEWFAYGRAPIYANSQGRLESVDFGAYSTRIELILEFQASSVLLTEGDRK